VALLEGDLLDPLPGDLDLICANLPYLAEGVERPPEVLAQPHHALFAPDAGASLIRRVLRQAPAHLAQGGGVLLEIDQSVLEAIGEELSLFASHRVHRDLQGQIRVLEAC
jgi:methylase of polypeptide subunit release factors